MLKMVNFMLYEFYLKKSEEKIGLRAPPQSGPNKTLLWEPEWDLWYNTTWRKNRIHSWTVTFFKANLQAIIYASTSLYVSIQTGSKAMPAAPFSS